MAESDRKDQFSEALDAVEKGHATLTEAVLAAAGLTRKSRQRRFAILLVLYLVSVFSAIQLHDEHVRRCMIRKPSPGLEQRLCDTFFPFHSHSPPTGVP